tara:strand:- start:471 stop:773 length:303 start_codon:yes stop_codon:yes gene_type:complete
MARAISDSVDVPSATTRVQISTKKEQVMAITFKARAGNSGNVYVGGATVSAASGFELAPGNSISIDPSQVSARDTTVPLSDFYVDAASSGDDVDFFALVK